MLFVPTVLLLLGYGRICPVQLPYVALVLLVVYVLTALLIFPLLILAVLSTTTVSGTAQNQNQVLLAKFVDKINVCSGFWFIFSRTNTQYEYLCTINL